MLIKKRLGAILILILIFQGANPVQIPVSHMEVVQGQSVVLAAWYYSSPDKDLGKNTVRWWRIDGLDQEGFRCCQGGDRIHTVSSPPGAKHDPQYVEVPDFPVISFSFGEFGWGQKPTGRVGFSSAMPSTNVSLYINSTEETDSGAYFCDILVPGGDSLHGEIRLNVIVPPSPPVCTMTGNPVVKGDVSLSCSSREGKPAPQYKWRKAEPHPSIFFPTQQNERRGILWLTELIEIESGMYTCRASNTAGSESCSINLEFPTSTYPTGMIALGSALALSIAILICTLFFILRRGRDHQEETANEIE